MDNFFWGTVMMFLVGIALAFYDPELAANFDKLFEGFVGRLVDIVLTLILCIVPNAFMIGLTGGNLGKWLFGICVFDRQDRPIGLSRAFQRELRIVFFGLGIGIPIITLITMIMAYQKLKEDRVTSWDQALDLKVVHRKAGPRQYLGSGIGIILLISMFAFLAWLNAQVT